MKEKNNEYNSRKGNRHDGGKGPQPLYAFILYRAGKENYKSRQ